MFKEADWEDDRIKTFTFKSFQKGTNQPGSNKESKEDKRKKRKEKQKALREGGDGIPETSNIRSGIVKKKDKVTKKKKDKLKSFSEAIQDTPILSPSSSKSLLSKLKDNLKGSRFRYLNEQLYTTSGTGGVELFTGKAEDFEAYHVGYRHQVEHWPMNPLRKIIGEVKKLPENLIIADFGCGDAMLAQSVPHKVYSIDLVSVRDDVIASDMANTPLKTGSIDVAIYCLSLMGLNLQDFFLEANRVLRIGGLVIIAEISSRFNSIDQFISNVSRCGFQLQRKETSHKMFVFFRFKKHQNMEKSSSSVKSFSLKPCLYKKR